MIPVAIEPELPYARRDCGWGALDTAAGRLPLAAVDIDARVVGLTSTTEVRQTFVNHLREAIEATYVFPLPDRAAVQRFRMVAGERVIEGVLDERGAARASYDQPPSPAASARRSPRRIAPACSRCGSATSCPARSLRSR
jgi:Ca-activated chloride channel family protein